MSSGGKGGGASQSKNYYGTIAVTFCWGPMDWLRAVIANGNYWFKADAGLNLVNDVTDLTGSLIDPSMVAPGGYLKFYRGTETQPADPALAGHPPYKGTPVLVGHRVFFGQDSGVPPNLQIIGGRCPRVPTTIVAAEDNIVVDRQVNPIAALAEFILDERGAGRPEALLHAPSWLAAGHWCAQSQAHRDHTFISPLIVQPTSLRDIVRQLIEPFGGFLRWTKDGKLACCIYEWGVNPGGLPLIDATSWTAKPEFVDGTWEDVPTEVVVAYTDRDYQFQDNSVPVPNELARKVRQLDDSRPLERKHTMRRWQAAAQGAEYIRRIGAAPGSGKVRIRAPLFPELLPGDKVLVDVDPEPGGAGSAQLCRIEKITQDASDEATLELMTDALLPAQSYAPNWPVVEVPPDAECPPIAHALAIALPVEAFGSLSAVALLAARPTAEVTGFHVLFGTSAEDDFADLGYQSGFAVRATLAADIAAGALAASFTQTDGLDGPDAALAANTPGGNLTAAEDDVLVAVLASLDAEGRVALVDGVPVMEFVSIVSRAPVEGATFSYALLRGRLGTTARAWAAATTAVWIVPRVNLVEWRHALISPDPVAAKLLHFRLVAFNDLATDDSDPLPAADLWLPLRDPALDAAFVDHIFKLSAAQPATPTGDGLPADWLDAPNGPGKWWLSIGRKTSDDRLIGEWSTPVDLSGAPGAPGANGTNAPNVVTQYSANGVSGWHATPEATDYYMRMSNDGGATWSAAIKIRGENGTNGSDGRDGSDGTNGTNGSDGLTAVSIYVVAASQPATPTGSNPSGWSTSIPSGVGAVWQSNGYKNSSGTLVGSWSTPQRISGSVTYAQTSAPTGALRAGDIWFDTTGYPDNVRIKVRNAANNGWDDNTINQLSVSKLLAGTIQAISIILAGGGDIRSSDYVSGSSGWMFGGTGGLDVGDALIRAKLNTGATAYNPAAPNNTMPMFATKTAANSSAHSVNGTENIYLLSVRGWAVSSGFGYDRFGKSTMVFSGSFYSAFNLAGTDYADLYGVYRINGGSWQLMAPGSRNSVSSGGGANTTGAVEIAGLNGSDVIDFGVRVVTPGSRSYQYGSMSVTWGNI